MLSEESIDSLQLAVGSWQLAVGSWQLAVKTLKKVLSAEC